MRALVTGASGLLGHEVVKLLGDSALGVSSKEMDLCDMGAVSARMLTYKPEAVIHCAAYTAVDLAETERERCFAVNVAGTENVARCCALYGAKMVMISSDYVFDGSGDQPFETNTPKKPINYYGMTKAMAEDAASEILNELFIVRTSWIFGENGTSFVKTILKKSAEKRIEVVSDQIGSPTYAADLAALLCEMAESRMYGVYHATNEGFCSWHEFANEICRLAGSETEVSPVLSKMYKSAAMRPKNSRLSKASLTSAGFQRMRGWQDALRDFMNMS